MAKGQWTLPLTTEFRCFKHFEFRTGHKELSDFKRGTVIGGHLWHQSIHEISALLDLPSQLHMLLLWSGSALEQQQLSHKSWVLKHVLRKHRLSSIASFTTEFQTASGSSISTQTAHRELHEMSFHGWAAAPKPHITMCNASTGAVYSTLQLDSGAVETRSFGVMNQASVSGSLMGESGFGGWQENANYGNV